MDEKQLEHLAWKMMKFMGKDNAKSYDQSDIMKVCNVNIADAIEISDFLVKMKACNYITK